MKIKHDYYDLILALLGSLDPSQEYANFQGNLNIAIDELKGKYKEKYPNLFGGIFFSRRPPLPPYSSQIEQVLSGLGMSGYLEWYVYPGRGHVIRHVDKLKKGYTSEFTKLYQDFPDMCNLLREKMVPVKS